MHERQRVFCVAAQAHKLTCSVPADWPTLGRHRFVKVLKNILFVNLKKKVIKKYSSPLLRQVVFTYGGPGQCTISLRHVFILVL
jgi:hypothetical protein